VRNVTALPASASGFRSSEHHGAPRRYVPPSRRDSFAEAGLAAAEGAGAETYFFDDQDFDSGYFAATLPEGHASPRGASLPSIVREVDHIVYMPRIGTHILAGNTLGQKMAVGWLRDDSRHDLHNEAGQFYEKFAEVNYAREIVERFRLAVTVSERILLHGGPDHGTPYDMTPVLVHASSSLPNHDTLAASLLATLNANITTVAPGAQGYAAARASSTNGFFAHGFSVATGAAGPRTSGSTTGGYTAHDWERGVTQDRALARGWALTGGRPASLRVVSDGAALDATVASGIAAHGEGLYAFT